MTKDFTTNNPALAFLSSASKTYKAHNTSNTSKTYKAHNTSNTSETYKAHNTSNTSEKKSRRFNGKFYPSVMDDIEIIARIQGTTPNDLINKLLKEYCDKNIDLIQKFKSAFL
jgi:hypothetical protein